MRRLGSVLILCGVALAATVPSAGAAGTRAEYATAVNAVCTSAAAEAKALLKGSRPRPANGRRGRRGDELKQLSRSLKSFRRILRRLTKLEAREIESLAAVSAAPGDEQLVAEWMVSLRRVHHLSKPASRLSLNFLGLFLKLILAIENDELKSKKAVRLGKKFKLVSHQLDRVTNKLLNEDSNASVLAFKLGATKCGGDTSPDAKPAARRAEARALAARYAQAIGS